MSTLAAAARAPEIVPPAGTTSRLAESAFARFADRPPAEILERAALTLTDTVACAIAGSGLSGGTVVARELGRLGGVREATSIGWGERLPAPAAAFINATLANVADLDDNLLYHVHIACTVVPAALAVAEAVDATGEELLAAIAVGYDVAARISLSQEAAGRIIADPPDLEIAWPASYGHSGNTLGVAIAAGCLLGLTSGQLRHALGIAAYAAPLPTIARAVQLPRPPHQRYAAYGAMAQAGVMGARLAGAGMTADENVLDGASGFWRMAGSARVAPEFLTAQDAPWWIDESSYKREPACSWARPAMRALRGLLAEHPVAPHTIERIVVRTHLLSQTPMFLETELFDYAGAQMSFPFAMAAVCTGLPEERWYDADAITDPVIAGLMPRVEIAANLEATRAVWEQIRDVAWPRRVRRLPTEVSLHVAGDSWTATAEYGDGDPAPGCAFGPAEVAAKFVRHARRRLGADTAAAMASQLLDAGQSPARSLLAALHEPE